MRRRSRNRGTWFPILPTIFEEGGASLTFDNVIQQTNIGEPSFGQWDRIGLDIVPLTYDFTQTTDQAASDAGVSLRDLVEGQDCIIDRVVGKVFCGIGPATAGSLGTVIDAITCAALAVFPVDDETQASALEADDMDPLLANNAQQPWMWRRVWILKDPTYAATTTDPYGSSYPSSNAAYGSVMDGPHLDTKGVRRRITKEQRIFIVFSSYVMNLSTAPGVVDTNISWTYDVRIHGAMRKARNRSTFK